MTSWNQANDGRPEEIKRFMRVSWAQVLVVSLPLLL